MNKKISKQSQNKISTDEESDGDLNCSCEILNDTSLSNVSDQSCDCSECLEANLNAFNQFKETQQQQKLKHARSLDKIQTKTKILRKQQQPNNGMRSTTRYGRASNISPSKNQHQKSYISKGQQTSNIEDSKSQKYFTQQNINDYIMITKQRTRQYLNQRDKISKQNKKEKENLKQKIKENLEILKYTVQALQQKQPSKASQKDSEQENKETLHHYKWNHTPAISRKLKQIRKKKTQCKRKIQQRKAQRKKVDTNLQKIVPEFSQNPSEFLKQVKEKRLQKFKQCKGCPYDHCPNHHMRTSNEKLQQIQKFIKDQVKKYNENKKKQKQKKQDNDKIKKAKLRAIDLKCKEILQRSKRYDPTQSRTSFRLSIDHFSTFSDLKVNKKEKEEQKQHRKQVKKMLKQKGGRLQQAIYEDAFEQQRPPQPKTKPYQKLEIQNLLKKDYCQKITKDAKIRSPRNIKPDDEKYKQQKQQKRKIPMNPNQEKKKTKEVALQIQRKKHELMQEYRRQQQLKKSKNQKLKNQHKESLMQSRG